MENRDLERTEELLQQSRKKKKTPIIIAAVIAALVIAGIGGFAAVKANKNKEVTKNLDQAEKYLAEGEYDQAVAAYTAAIDIDEKSAPAYKGRARANAKLGNKDAAYSDIDRAIEIDPKDEDGYRTAIDIAIGAGDADRADKYIEDMHKNIGGTEDETLESMLMGCSPEDLAADGIVCQSGSDYYVANMPDDDSESGRGCITKVSRDGKKETVYKVPNIADTQYVCKLNIWDGWIYYSVTDLMHLDGETTEFHRVRTDGSGDERLRGDFGKEYNWTAEFAVINGKIYYTNGSQDIGRYLWVCEPDGSNPKKAVPGFAGYFTSDGRNIYYSTWTEQGSYGGIWKLDTQAGKSEKISALNPSMSLSYYDGAVYFFGFEGSEHPDNEVMTFYRLDTKTNEAKAITTANAGYGNLAVHDGVCYQPNTHYDQPTDFAVDSDIEGQVTTINPEDGSTGLITHIFTPEEVRLYDAKGVTIMSSTAGFERQRVIGDRIYYMISRWAYAEETMENRLGPVFGNMAMDGSDNVMYGYSK